VIIDKSKIALRKKVSLGYLLRSGFTLVKWAGYQENIVAKLELTIQKRF
jgi:hypothetical protein